MHKWIACCQHLHILSTTFYLHNSLSQWYISTSLTIWLVIMGQSIFLILITRMILIKKITWLVDINMIKKKNFSGGFAPELFMVLRYVCAKFEPFLYFKINCKIILKFWWYTYIIVFRLTFISIPHGLLG